MKNRSRSSNAKLNILIGYLAQAGIFILSFVGRKVFLLFFSADYLGINGLYSNILTVLSIAELGLDTAIVYSLYKPVSENNTVLIKSLLNYFHKIYLCLASVVFLIGLSLMPFLQYLVTSNIPIRELRIYYLLFLINSVASYFVAHKSALLSASQQQRAQKLVSLCSNFALQVVYIIVLIAFKNYYIYVSVTVLNTIITNLIISKVAERTHAEVFSETNVVKFDKTTIQKRIISAFLYKIGAVMINSTDNILISVLVSTAAVGYYSNYNIIVVAVNSLIAIITTSLIAGVGNLVASDSNSNQTSLFDMMVLCYHFIGALGLIGFSLMFNDLIDLWLGNQYLFENRIVYIIAVNFYLTTAISPVWMFREANGLFSKVKYLLLIRAGINIVLSVFLGMYFDVFGILLATAISLLLTNFWIEPNIISKDIFRRKPTVYWKKQFKYLLITITGFALCTFITNNIANSAVMIIVKSILICVITGMLFLLTNYNSFEIKKLKAYLIHK